MEVVTLASGSSGNSILITAGSTHVLVDCGISCRRIGEGLKGLGLSPADLAAVFITHEHSDHIAGLCTLTKRFALPVYTSPGTALELRRRMVFPMDILREVSPGERVKIGDAQICPFATSHDAAQPMGYSVTDGYRRSAVVTDLGYVSGEVLAGVLGAELVVCEANHDEDWLLSGPYPYYLKRRILGDQGHLCNEAGGELARKCVENGAKTVILAHLSAENNTPARARDVVGRSLRDGGIDPEGDVTLTVAPRGEPSRVFEV